MNHAQYFLSILKLAQASKRIPSSPPLHPHLNKKVMEERHRHLIRDIFTWPALFIYSILFFFSFSPFLYGNIFQDICLKIKARTIAWSWFRFEIPSWYDFVRSVSMGVSKLRAAWTQFLKWSNRVDLPKLLMNQTIWLLTSWVDLMVSILFFIIKSILVGFLGGVLRVGQQWNKFNRKPN